ncbi:MAG: DJ-1/PfpI family protein [Candidatus Pacebacteria bacterium]|nr:DJ-1/PfpI family protein [Candidatus Paceibacterota bacterium]MDD3072598.1 DJ-1/PfpI family protein [Candidatus Paceibacterota bacterium]MDD3728920.1 DJ-1/PfpI family protein [Candidatus Paceibacterota bacterium]MDD4201536.1 DJ-1/PfpI family protein [Candidatus Paceibacterota bacterium]MDD4897405.1 DJ-1/PfpI family protein [Candidatus Paceibacterota bacterium]
MEKEKIKRIALIVAFKDFRDEEYFIPKEIFKKEKIQVKTFSDFLGKAIGKFGGEAKVDDLIDNLNVDDFDGVVFIGGPGAEKYVENERCLEIAREAEKKEKVLGAICIAPLILSSSGVLENRKATVWSSQMDKSAIKELKNSGAIYFEKSVAIDGKIVTGSMPEASELFAREIIKIL